MSSSERVVKCPSCGRFVAQISGPGQSVTVVVNCKKDKCSAELKIEYNAGAVTVSVVGKSSDHHYQAAVK